MTFAQKWRGTTVFLGCGFAAKYLHGGGNFSVPLQWMKGLVRLGLDALWLELMPATVDARSDLEHIHAFEQRLREHDLAGRYCLLYQRPTQEIHELEKMECYGISCRKLAHRLAGPSILLNLCYSIHPPLIYHFERRIYCDLDPGEMAYWMCQMEMGQSYHHEFWTLGLNIHAPDCRIFKTPVSWRTFYPLVDTKLIQPKPRPLRIRFTTIGQWYWTQGIEIDGEYPDLSKKARFEKYITLPSCIPEVEMELAMNLNADDPEIQRIQSFGWKLAVPHQIADSPQAYRKYIASSSAEFTACKGTYVCWRTGWLSDRSAAYLAMGRPVITEDTGAQPYLPQDSGFLWMSNLEEAVDAVHWVNRNWEALSIQARRCAVEMFDSAKNLEKILGA